MLDCIQVVNSGATIYLFWTELLKSHFFDFDSKSLFFTFHFSLSIQQYNRVLIMIVLCCSFLSRVYQVIRCWLYFYISLFFVKRWWKNQQVLCLTYSFFVQHESDKIFNVEEHKAIIFDLAKKNYREWFLVLGNVSICRTFLQLCNLPILG